MERSHSLNGLVVGFFRDLPNRMMPVAELLPLPARGGVAVVAGVAWAAVPAAVAAADDAIDTDVVIVVGWRKG